MSNWRIAGAGLVSLALVACTGGIDPAVKQIDVHTLGLSDAPAPAVDETWWKVYGDPQLDHIVDAALLGNPTLDQALARLRSAASGVAAARSQEFPQVSLDGNEQRLQFSQNYIFPPPYGGTARWYGTVAGNLSWDIDLWGRQAALVDKARALGHAAQFDTDGAKLAIEGAVVSAYVALDEAYALSDVAHETVAEREHIVKLTALRVKDGLDSKVDLSQAQTILDEARKDDERAASNCDLAIHTIAALMGRGADAYPGITRPRRKLDAALELPQELPADLLSRRPDILSARARIEAAVHGRAAAKAAFYPDINLLATAGFASIGLSRLIAAGSEQYGGGPAVHLPIFDAGQLRAQYASATADLDMAVADYNGAVTGAIHDTADRLTQIRSLDLQAEQQAKFSADADQGYRLAETSWRSGLANQLTLLNAESLLLQARQQQAMLDAEQASERIHLILAIGGGFDSRAASTAPEEEGIIP
ncbi:MAG: efflux transporter outer membrane subunit [Rhizomicrobium sp.]|jgi:NodT family efflux transporter outer membrane factor (OMF) lipoprotein